MTTTSATISTRNTSINSRSSSKNRSLAYALNGWPGAGPAAEMNSPPFKASGRWSTNRGSQRQTAWRTPCSAAASRRTSSPRPQRCGQSELAVSRTNSHPQSRVRGTTAPLPPAFWRALANAWAITTSIRTLWNNESRWNTQRIPEECLVATQRHSERHSCSLFSA